MKALYGGALLSMIAISGCQEVQGSTPLPTVNSDGTLVIPPGYKPQPDIDLSRVDCRAYLEMNSAELRDMAEELCMQSKTLQEQSTNPYCQIQKVNQVCLEKNIAKPPQ